MLRVIQAFLHAFIIKIIGCQFSLFFSLEFENLQEAFFSLENGSVEGILEEMFTGIEFMKRKPNKGLSIAQVFERQHYYGAGIKRDGFSAKVLDCLQKVVNFVSEDIYSNTSRLLKSFKVRSSHVSYTPFQRLYEPVQAAKKSPTDTHFKL